MAYPDNRQFKPGLQRTLVNFRSWFGCHEVPKPENLRHLLLEIGWHEFMIKAVRAVAICDKCCTATCTSEILEGSLYSKVAFSLQVSY